MKKDGGKRKNELHTKILEIFHLKKPKEKETTTEQIHFRKNWKIYIINYKWAGLYALINNEKLSIKIKIPLQKDKYLNMD